MINSIINRNSNSLIFEVSFWRKNWLFLVIASSILFLIMLLSGKTYPSGEENSLITGFSIILHVTFFLWVLYISFMILSKIYVEMEISKYVSEEVNRYKRQASNNVSERASLTEMESKFLPKSTIHRNLPVFQMFTRICRDALEHRIDDSSVVVEVYQYETQKSLSQLKSIQRLALWFGVLGTFIGLIMALDGVSGVFELQPGSTDFNSQVNNLVAGLTISFGTSIAGIEIAVFAGFVYVYIENVLGDYFSQLESSVNDLQNIARYMSYDDDKLVYSLRHVAQKVDNSNKQLDTHAKIVSSSLEKVSDSISTQTKAIRTGMNEIEKTSADFSVFLSNIKQSQDSMVSKMSHDTDRLSASFSGNMEELTNLQKSYITDLKKIYNPNDIINLRDSLRVKMHEDNKLLISAFEKHMSDVNQTFNSISKSVEKIEPGLVNLESGMKSNIKSESEAMRVDFSKLIDDFGRDVVSLKFVLSKFEKSLTSAVNLNASSVEELSKGIGNSFYRGFSFKNFISELLIFSAKAGVTVFMIGVLFANSDNISSNFMSFLEKL